MPQNLGELNINDEQMKELIDSANGRINDLDNSLSLKAQEMPDRDVYKALVDYCVKGIREYVSNPDNIKLILTDPHNIQGIFEKLSQTEEFAKIASEEYRNFPKVVLMSIITGTECAIADESVELLGKDNPIEKGRLDSLANVYHGYLQDALNYGKGEDKNVAVTGFME